MGECTVEIDAGELAIPYVSVGGGDVSRRPDEPGAASIRTGFASRVETVPHDDAPTRVNQLKKGASLSPHAGERLMSGSGGQEDLGRRLASGSLRWFSWQSGIGPSNRRSVAHGLIGVEA